MRPGHPALGRRSRWAARKAAEQGYAAVLVAIIVPFMGIGLAATAVDTGMWYVEVEKVQKAADAAALAGVPYLPMDMPNATTRAQEVAERNGYDDDAADVEVEVSLGAKATQLQVTISSVIDNQFGSAIGVPRTTIRRSAVADYQGPAPMGSPCNTFGNEPDSGNGASAELPSGTAQASPPLSNCPRVPQFWATVEGPQTTKLQGDRYQTKNCGNSSVDGCTSGQNDEYDEFGYTFVVRVSEAATGLPIELQLYDPMFVNTGQDCSLLPSASTFPVNTSTNRNRDVNPYVKNSDAVNRYSDNGAYNGKSFKDFCTGDYYPGGSGPSMTTSFVLREQTDTQNPEQAPVQTGNSGAACIKQYGSYNTGSNSISANVLTSTSGSYNAEIARHFHNWVEFCTFTPPRAGDYYLQVRTNVSLGGSGGTYVRSGNSNAAAAAGNTSSGAGDNSFAMRAVTAPGYEDEVAISGFSKMPIFVNSDAAQVNFNLIRVLPGAAGQKISFHYFDAGDAQGNGSVRVILPDDARSQTTGGPLTDHFPGGCTAYGGSAGGGPNDVDLLSDCSAPFVKVGSNSLNNGKTETITIPIPADYTCNFESFGGCWYKVRVEFGSGTVNDITTWDATVLGDPVRLVE
jgi:Flp pilus assembly protein TadG